MKTLDLISGLYKINELKANQIKYAELLNNQPVLKELYLKAVLAEEKMKKKHLYYKITFSK